MTQRRIEYYRPPDGSMSHLPKHKTAILTMRLLAFLFKMGMKAQAGIKTSDVSFYVERMEQRLPNN